MWIGKGVNKQMYLGGYECERKAAQAYDMTALKTKGCNARTNFSKDRCWRRLWACVTYNHKKLHSTKRQRLQAACWHAANAYRQHMIHVLT